MERNIRFDLRDRSQDSRQVQLARLRRVMDRELTPVQREVVLAYYIQGKTMAAIAQSRGVHRSTVLRTLLRAKKRLQRSLTY